MFARKVSMQLKPGGAAEFKQIVEREVIPLLRKQKGFVDEITVAAGTPRVQTYEVLNSTFPRSPLLP